MKIILHHVFNNRYLFFNAADRQKSVNVAFLLLAVAPHARCGLFVDCGIPVGVEEHKPVRADQIETAAAGLRAESRQSQQTNGHK